MRELRRTQDVSVWEAATRSEAETIALGRAIGEALRSEDIVLLFGELGAGKTRLVQGIAKGIGCKTAARSPTFVLVSELRGHITVHHCDLYRLSGPDEVDDLGLMDLLDRGDALAVEWADRAREAFPADALEVNLEISGQGEARLLRFQARGDRSVGLLQSVVERAKRAVGASA